MSVTRPRGTNDFLPEDTIKWQQIEKLLRDLCADYGYQEIRTPIFEDTELFVRGVGGTTDIVQKEMYTFIDQGDRSLTLRPENTASAARAYLENKMFGLAQPVKLYYMGPMFRYERPQAGRFRQFHQFGIEVFGSPSPLADAEIIAFAWEFYNRLGLKGLSLQINSVGCPSCRPHHKEALKDFCSGNLDKFCATCQERFERNPLRIFDCKSPVCQELLYDSPEIIDHLCSECAEHFAVVKKLLDAANIPYEINPRLVRGLDYYTKTAFEISLKGIGAQSAVCGGGRYDGLISDLGGQPTPSVGFALGMERIFAALKLQDINKFFEQKLDVYIAVLDQEEKTLATAFKLASELRLAGLACEQDLLTRSLKSQFKQADRLNAAFSVIVGGEELAEGKAQVRNLASSSQELLPLENICNYLMESRDK